MSLNTTQDFIRIAGIKMGNRKRIIVIQVVICIDAVMAVVFATIEHSESTVLMDISC